MNQHYCAIQQKSNLAGCGEEMMMRRNSVVVCPKPRRVGCFDGVVNDNARSRRWHVSQQQQDWCDTQAANELFDIILTKGASAGVEQQAVSAVVPVDSPPPFFCGSPPSRVSNPLIQDARFVNGKGTPVSPRMVTSPSTSTRKGGLLRENFGNNPVVRVEGFDCLDRDRRVGSIPTLA